MRRKYTNQKNKSPRIREFIPPEIWKNHHKAITGIQEVAIERNKNVILISILPADMKPLSEERVKEFGENTFGLARDILGFDDYTERDVTDIDMLTVSLQIPDEEQRKRYMRRFKETESDYSDRGGGDGGSSFCHH